MVQILGLNMLQFEILEFLNAGMNFSKTRAAFQ